MGSFLVVAAREGAREWADSWFDKGLQRARQHKGQEPRHLSKTAALRVATFPRSNGTGGGLALDDGTGDWLLTIGTWLHRSGAGPGREPELLARLREVGAESLGRELEGFFVVVAGNRNSGAITVVTDLIGSCHAFQRADDGVVALGGSAMVLAGLAPTSLDLLAAQELLQTGIVYEDRTPYREVKKLPPSSVVEIERGEIRTTRAYWSMGELAGEPIPGETAIEQWAGAVTDAARGLGTLFERPVCDLTGGYDSRALAALLPSREKIS